jgi:hypothetical protein
VNWRLPPIAGKRKLAGFREGGASARRTPFVVEGDEYDTAFFEKTPKFWHYKPEVAIVTSVEHDHIDIYKDEASYEAAFRGFVERVPEHGLLVASAHDPKVVALAQAARAPVAYYALSTDETGGAPPHWMGAMAPSTSRGAAFDLYVGGVFGGRVQLAVPGEHNARNAIAAIAAVCQGYGVDVKAAMAAIERFEGVARRQDLLYTERGVRAYDDFAHHPTAVRETLAALRSKHPAGRLFAVFEPRSERVLLPVSVVSWATLLRMSGPDPSAWIVLLAVVPRSRILRSLVSPAPTYTKLPWVPVAFPRTTAFPSFMATPPAPTLEVAPPVLLPREVTTKVPASTEVTPV